jgi:D-3-phosphoglycerate dehydrogenase
VIKYSFDKEKIKILLLEGIHESALKNFQMAKYSNIECIKTALSEKELIEKISDVHILGIRSRTQLTEKVFQAAKRLITVGAFCIGTNQIDLTSAMIHGIPVFNAPYSNTRSVAEMVLGEIIMLMRNIPEKNAQAHRGVWQKTASSSNEIRGKKLGIVGYGNIGSQLSILAESLGMRVAFYDIIAKLPLGNAIQVENLDDLLKDCDIITLHVPETNATQNMIGAEQIALMKPGSILVNASRGTVVDIEALSEALKKKQLRGAAVDVFPYEPQADNEEFKNSLREYENVIITPHIGGSTTEAQANIGHEVSEKLIKYSDNGSTITAVNFPEVSLPAHPGKHRLLHIHKNVSGVLSNINKIFSENNVNISAQYLQTNEKIGYVVIDIDAEHSDIALAKLKQVDTTIKTRVLF